ncbi:2Fe-2S iron-sulfur cluster binding domain-containing protein [Pseudoduganella umbonata]|uniref:2Fe-2S iron-sulfur cluster binding domain-containing protein n=1 Tax=Pseudoduganella umbonata TaxID=864828 RepID=A0A4P8HV01_9BURK|nr:2Fe-2S iron-sulfur cluster binding domain-containing protein [Pseudoduganella umbonata]MBB3222094.1 Na(+)-translocating NADH:ubiquinone oxidoreductase F subunit [Pseudoduganella umbonata]QCP12334.1 2Fe-2S iron-sulfur cluster binding domain-containing protein [Pseudoduganella umbonata]
MSHWMRRLHKWVGLILAIQFLLWMSSGVVMSLLDAKKVQGREFRVKPPAPPVWPHNVLSTDQVLAASRENVMAITSGWLVDRPVYRLQNDKRSWLVGAADGKAVAVDAGLAREIARASYSGSGKAGTPLLLNFTLEARAHKEPVWRIDFDDADETSVYVSSRSGAVLEHRNSTWRLFDLFWMLHIMDYSERTNFNNPLLVSSAIGGLWMALTGVWLLFASVRLAEFVPSRWRRRRIVNLVDASGATQRSVDAVQGDTVFQALARSGLQLPSNCGGGQSCGLCEVRCVGQAPEPTGADRALLSPQKLEAGYRLACNLPVKRSLNVDVGNALASSAERVGVVTSVKPVTPFLREITVRPQGKMECRPGAYVQIHVPAYARDASHVHVPEEHQDDWRTAGPMSTLANDAPVRRSYSISVPVECAGSQLTFLVRFMPGERPGRGSGYMYTLKLGDEVCFSGPFGDFALKPGSREKVFIGGGAGMAPLRAMIHELLLKGATEPLHFWYGARSRRDAPYVQEMQTFATKHTNFHWHLVLSEEQPEYGAPVGWVHEAVLEGLLRKHPNIASVEFYVCGPPAMLSSTCAMLRSLGVEEANIAYDDFKI